MMKRRIIAWALLAGFVLLLLNILIFRFYLELCSAAYIIIVMAFVLTGGNLFSAKPENDPGPGGRNDEADGGGNDESNGGDKGEN